MYKGAIIWRIINTPLPFYFIDVMIRSKGFYYGKNAKIIASKYENIDLI